MPSRVSLLRILLIPPTVWLALVALWILLPVNPVEWNDDPSQYLWDGGVVTRVYNFADFFPLNDPLPSVQEARNTRRTSFAIDYHYCSRTGELTISGNGAGVGVSKCQSASRHCSGSRTLQSSDDESQSQTQTEPTSRPERTNSSHHLHSDSHIYNISALLYSSTLPHVSAPFILHAKAGDPVDETADQGFSIMLPSFSEADATLLSWEIYRDVAELPLRMRAVDESTVQIWPDSKYWDADRAKGLRNPGDTPQKFPPLLSIKFNTTKLKSPPTTIVDTQLPFRIRFPNPGSESNSSPSQTFVIRRTICSLVVPVALFLDKIFDVFIYASITLLIEIARLSLVTLAIYFCVVLACWKSQGLPPFTQFARTFWLTKVPVACLSALSVWCGLSRDQDSEACYGDDEYIRGEKEKYLYHQNDDPEGHASGRHRPLTGVRDFFLSRSPLDDLLVTFEATRGLVRPWSGRNRTHRDQNWNWDADTVWSGLKVRFWAIVRRVNVAAGRERDDRAQQTWRQNWDSRDNGDWNQHRDREQDEEGPMFHSQALSRSRSRSQPLPQSRPRSQTQSQSQTPSRSQVRLLDESGSTRDGLELWDVLQHRAAQSSTSRDSSATYIHMSASRNADLFEEFCRPPSSTTGFPGLAANSTHPQHAGATHHPYAHPQQQQQHPQQAGANGSADAAGMAQLQGHFMPFEEIALPPHLMPMNPEDEDGVVPDMHAAFGINRALGQNQGGGIGGGGGSGGAGGVGGSGGAVEPGGEASNAGVQREPAWRDLGLTALVADERIGSAAGARPPPRREGKRTGVLLLR
ncbi:hypothetical protein ABEF95_001805 [Exophiala dermatitidis]